MASKNNLVQYYFVDDHKFIYSGNKFIDNPRIIKFDPSIFWLKGLKAPIPSYLSIDELIKSDKRYKEFKKKRNKTAELIALEENIVSTENYLLQSNSDDPQAGNMIRHIIEGYRTSNKFSGIHYLPDPLPSNIVNYKEVTPPNEYGVYKASFEVIKNGKPLRKEQESTMFPKSWSVQRLYDECTYALENKIQDNEDPRLFRSKTLSNIPVLIIIDESGVVKTLYPE